MATVKVMQRADPGDQELDPTAPDLSEFDVPPVEALSPAAGRAFFDAHARQSLGLSGEEFLRRFEAGEYDAVLDDPDHREVLHLAMLVPFARQHP